MAWATQQSGVVNKILEDVKTSLVLIALVPEETQGKNRTSKEAKTARVVVMPPSAPTVGRGIAELCENRLSLLWHSKS